MRRLTASRTPARVVTPQYYCCGRCGIVKRYNSSRQRPEFCPDCRPWMEES